MIHKFEDRPVNRLAALVTSKLSDISCAKEGERPRSNLDWTKGKIDPYKISTKCCAGLKSISNDTYKMPNGGYVCKTSFGVPNGICSPCGNGVCDSALENWCNCPEDCPK